MDFCRWLVYANELQGGWVWFGARKGQGFHLNSLPSMAMGPVAAAAVLHMLPQICEIIKRTPFERSIAAVSAVEHLEHTHTHAPYTVISDHLRVI